MFSPDGTLISASAAPHCGGNAETVSEKKKKKTVSEKKEEKKMLWFLLRQKASIISLEYGKKSIQSLFIYSFTYILQIYKVWPQSDQKSTKYITLIFRICLMLLWLWQCHVVRANTDHYTVSQFSSYAKINFFVVVLILRRSWHCSMKLAWKCKP